MKEFFESNKIFLGIVIAGALVAGAIYFSGNSSGEPAKTSINENLSARALSVSRENAETLPVAADNSTVGSCIPFKDAGKHVGEKTCVTGTALQVFTSAKGTTFFDFCANYKTCPFTAVVFASDAAKFSNLSQYEKKTVEISGLLTTYQGKAEIILNEPAQIKIR